LKANDNQDVIGGYDPHVWLSPKNAEVMAQNIMNGLTEVDPSNRNYYIGNGKMLIDNLKQLDEDFSKGLANCSKHIVLVGHNAFSFIWGFKNFARCT